MSAPVQLIRLQPRRTNKRGLRVAVRVALCALCLALLGIAAGLITRVALGA
ncbi:MULTISPECIES: hypothetical protein [unclassified Acidovorax]|jgi:hypothetical protein|uniref:hypothetical protein n=1 Tax=unclassified Acidovorax TaxID=2684926 RepID=UPI001C46EA02|nr:MULTISPECIES: hypothetical protein [unclassified Acidovorax]MBV7459456.1 hypothetical protein [Acidovorax sp. sif0632]MBV7464481.1 hypothetical protein [Acidovorax sp. sif0613]